MDSKSTVAKEVELQVPAFIGNNYFFYITVIFLFVILKVVFRYYNDWSFFIWPIDKLVGFAVNSQSVPIPPGGYYHESLNIIIDKSCSGVNFMIICFISLCFITPRYLLKKKYCFTALPLLMIISYILTILVNSMRIIFFVTTRKLHDFLHLSDIPGLHLIEGAFIYLTSLILIYMAYNYLLNKYTGGNNAEYS